MIEMQTDEDFMQQSIAAGKGNPKYPFGAVLVLAAEQKVVASGTNASSSNPLLHGEIAAIRNASDDGWDRWSELTLYSTAEPCPMCAGAIVWAGISRVVFGTSIATLIRNDWPQIAITAQEVIGHSQRPDIEIVSGVLEQECDRLFANAKRLQQE
jgi:tRNA(Arg) A34 adenosine deaminase TadA